MHSHPSLSNHTLRHVMAKILMYCRSCIRVRNGVEALQLVSYILLALKT